MLELPDKIFKAANMIILYEVNTLKLSQDRRS